MIRRNVAAGGPTSPAPISPGDGRSAIRGSGGAATTSGSSITGSHLHGHRQHQSSSPRRRSMTDMIVALLLIASIILTILSFLFPSAQQAVVREVEHEGVVVQEMLKKAEDELLQHWHAHHEAHAAIPPKTIEQQQLERKQQQNGGISSHHQIEDAYDAELAAASDRRMQQATDGSWVEGEKKLKQKLKILAERQAQGKDLGVPVLTRWLGEDIPAWPSDETMPEAEWQRRVDAKYAEMRLEEMAWRERMTESIQNVNHG